MSLLAGCRHPLVFTPGAAIGGIMFNALRAPRRARATLAVFAGFALVAGLLGLAAPAAVAAGGGSISGSVAAWAGDAVPNAKVCAIADSDHSLDRCVTADAYGRYSIAGLADDVYTVTVTAPGWDNQNCCTYGEFVDDGSFYAKPVEVTDGDAHSGITVVLRGTGRITGKVTDTKGKPLGGTVLHVFFSWGQAPVTTDSKGRYSVNWLEGQGKRSLILSGTSWLYSPSSSLPEAVHGKVIVQNFVVPVGTGVQGRIAFSPEGGSYGVFAYPSGVEPTAGNWRGVGFGTASTGRPSYPKYQIWLNPGRYNLQFADGFEDYFSPFPKGTLHNSSPIPVKVTAGKLTTLPVVSYQRPVAAGSVEVSGAAKVGVKVAAKTVGWASGTRFSYQWLRDGRAIRWAQGPRYRLHGADLGHRISVTVTGRKPGYRPTSVTSPSTVAVSRI